MPNVFSLRFCIDHIEYPATADFIERRAALAFRYYAIPKNNPTFDPKSAYGIEFPICTSPIVIANYG